MSTVVKVVNNTSISLTNDGKFTAWVRGKQVTRASLSAVEKIILDAPAEKVEVPVTFMTMDYYSRHSTPYVREILDVYQSRDRWKNWKMKVKREPNNYYRYNHTDDDFKQVYEYDPEIIEEYNKLSEEERAFEESIKARREALSERMVKLTPEEVRNRLIEAQRKFIEERDANAQTPTDEQASAMVAAADAFFEGQK